MQKREHTFVEESINVLQELEQKWFPPGLKSREGYYYGCGYCDMECGGHTNHDKDCLPQMAKDTLLKISVINADKTYELDFQGKPRTKAESDDLRKYFIRRLILEEFFQPIMGILIPLDYQDPDNKSIICLCHMEKTFKVNRKAHSNHCVYQKLAQIISNLYKT
jgi:hypothetical protein